MHKHTCIAAMYTLVIIINFFSYTPPPVIHLAAGICPNHGIVSAPLCLLKSFRSEASYVVQTGHFLELVDGEINTWHLTCLMVSLGVRS